MDAKRRARLDNQLQIMEAKYALLNEKIMNSTHLKADEIASLSIECAALDEVVALYRQIKTHNSEILLSQEFIADANCDEESKKEMMQNCNMHKEAIEKLYPKVEIALLPKEQEENCDVIMEMRAGAGGDEASLFTADLLRMYSKYAEKQGWKLEILSTDSTGIDGYKEVILSISGTKVFSKLRFESGVHRVQRVPDTESSGRIHTSTVTVAVLPAPEDIEVEISEKDIRVDVYRSSGPGGQSVNTTDSAVRITHIPTGIVVCQQDEKSQRQNKEKAMRVLRARIYEADRLAQQEERDSMRKSQVGQGNRNEKIRTYNYPQQRITDHRINYTTHDLHGVLLEGKIQTLIDHLMIDYQGKRLADLSLD